jgi:CNT family concentrative nucleoside transporter
MDRYNLVSLAGVFGLMGVAWAFSTKHRLVNWRCIFGGVAIMLVMGGLVFWAPGSREVMLRVNDAVNGAMNAAQAGQEFVFGPLASAKTIGFILAFQALPMVIFFSALMGLLYYLRVMDLLIRGFAWVFTRVMRISGAESLSVSANIFVGVEAVTTVRPFLGRMTRSEFCTILTAGMATAASTTLAIYITALGPSFPTIAGHLISASFIAAAAAIVTSKLVVPEDGQPVTLGKQVKLDAQRDSNAFEAIINGAMAGVQLVVGIVALLIAFLGLLACVDGILGCIHAGWSLRAGLGYVFWPFAVLMGVPPADAAIAANLLGERLVATEIPAYFDLATAIREAKFTHPRSPVLIAYALCGFAHVASLAIFVGGTAALAPERRKDLAAVGIRALIAATLACLMTGAVAGVFYHSALTIVIGK